VPRTLYLGYDNTNLLKVHPIPPDMEAEEWAQPYSVRSFLYQVSRQFEHCAYSCSVTGTMYGEPMFADKCRHSDDFDDSEPCRIMTSWSKGGATCGTWDRIASLCQTQPEQRFLQDYLRYVKDRQFPMLLPQARIGIAERRRPDFVVFVPVQHWRYQQLAVQLDGAHPDEAAANDQQRDAYLAEYGYETISLRPAQRGYHEEVKRLVERIDVAMNMADTDAWEIAISTTVRKFTPPFDESIPF
jgi:hypothetical protein